jgi:hypothetical protein
MERVKMPLVLGRGLDRATGLAAAQPQFPVDARNVYGRDAKMSVRPGLAESGYAPLTWGTDLLEVIGMKSTHDVLLVVYDRDTLQIRIYRMDPSTGLVQTLAGLGAWGTLNSAAEYPVVSYDEADGRVMIAHAEASYLLRLPTVYYTPDFASPETVGTLTTLEADLDGTGVVHPVYFRAVCTHLEYMIGAGYGSNSDPDRGDVVRFSKPADPTTWSAPNFVLFGVKKEPVVAMKPVSKLLAVAKEDETWIMDGAVGSQFTPRRIDAKYGCVSARGMLVAGDRVFQWSKDGPRQVTTENTSPIGQPLELISPMPTDLPTRGPARLMFTAYDIYRYLGEWVWPDLESAAAPVTSYALSLWNPDDPRWTFFTREQPVSCAGILYGTDQGGVPDPPVGYPYGLLAVDV